MSSPVLPERRVAEALFSEIGRSASVETAMTAAVAELTFEPGVVLGGGKAGGAMVEPVAARFGRITGGVAVPPEHAGAVRGVWLLSAEHPLPANGSLAAVDALEGLLERSKGPVLFLLSGGASSMLGAPMPPLSLELLREAFAALLGGGLTVQEMNVVRRHLTTWGGGKFALNLAGRQTTALIVSDVLDDSLEAIGSGPVVPDPSTFADALAVARRVAGMPTAVVRYLEAGAAGGHAETLKPGDRLFASITSRIVLSNRMLVARLAEKLGATVLPPQAVSVTAAADHWAKVLGGAPGIYVAGGEPTVVLPRPHGRGGRNQHLVLEVAARARPREPWLFLSVGTDGIDGNSENAGAWIDGSAASGRSAELSDALAGFDAAPLCEKLGLAFRSGPTGSNLADVQLGIVGSTAFEAVACRLRLSGAP